MDFDKLGAMPSAGSHMPASPSVNVSDWLLEGPRLAQAPPRVASQKLVRQMTNTQFSHVLSQCLQFQPFSVATSKWLLCAQLCFYTVADAIVRLVPKEVVAQSFDLEEFVSKLLLTTATGSAAPGLS